MPSCSTSRTGALRWVGPILGLGVRIDGRRKVLTSFLCSIHSRTVAVGRNRQCVSGTVLLLNNNITTCCIV